jgi:hypothetical protein
MEQSALSVPGKPAKAPFLKKGGAFLVLRTAVPVSTHDAVIMCQLVLEVEL